MLKDRKKDEETIFKKLVSSKTDMDGFGRGLHSGVDEYRLERRRNSV